MPPNLDSTDKLFMKHSSKPYNPKLANIFFKSGMIEAWGRGFEKIKEACGLYDGQHHGQLDQDNDQDIMVQILLFCKEPKSASEIMQRFDLERSYFRRHYLDKMLESGRLKRTEPQKPKSKNQKYYS